MLFINTSMQNMSLKTKFQSLIDNTPHPCLNPSTLDTNTSENLRREHILDVFRTVQAAVLVRIFLTFGFGFMYLKRPRFK